MRISDELCIDESEIQESFIRAPGPGGQHVNKTATAVQLRFDAAHSSSLPPEVRDRLLRMAGKRLTREGVLVLEGKRYRSQERNRQDVRDRLMRLVLRAAMPPKKRRQTKPSRTSEERRLEQKRQRGEIKRLRERVDVREED